MVYLSTLSRIIRALLTAAFFVAVLAVLAFLAFSSFGENIKYIDINGNCKYITIKGNPLKCSAMENEDEFERVFVNPCLKPVEQNGILPSTEYCEGETYGYFKN